MNQTIQSLLERKSVRSFTEQDVPDEMFSVHTGKQDCQTWLKAFCDRKYNSAFSKEMTRSVRKYLEDFSEGKEDLF